MVNERCRLNARKKCGSPPVMNSQAGKLMRRLGALIALLFLGMAAHGQTFPEPRTIKVNDRVYVLLGPIQHANRQNQGYMFNSTVIVGDKGVILVGSGGSDEVGRHIARAVRKITDKPVTHVVTWKSRQTASTNRHRSRNNAAERDARNAGLIHICH